MVSSSFLDAHIQKAILEKTAKIARKYGVKKFKGEKKKKEFEYQFDSFTRRTVAGVSSALVV